MFHLIIFIIIFIVSYFIFNTLYDDGLKKEKLSNIKILSVLIDKFSLDENQIVRKEILNTVSIINAFIIALVSTVVDILGIEKIYSYIIALVLIITLIFGIYYIYGKILNKKWGKDKK